MSNRPSSIPNANQPAGSDLSLARQATNTVPNVSLNFSIAKVIAIFTVVAGHWFTGTILWIPVTFGLFIFAFSSAYFTSKAYGTKIDRQRFWRKKLERLGLRFWVILSFLSLILLATGKPVLHWHSLVHFLGLSGVLNWFAIPNRSTLGAGLWFFTLLLLFYIAYPYLVKISEKRANASLIALTASTAALFLEMKVKVGHELWLTALGFVLGIVYGLHEPKVSQRSAIFLSGLFFVSLLLVNLFSSYKQFNPILILATSISLSVWVSKVRLPVSGAAQKIAKMDIYLLEIFLIHTYLFIHISGNTIVDFLISVLLIVMVAIALNRVVVRLSSIVFTHQEVRNT
jgi:hypothetical protein